MGIELSFGNGLRLVFCLLLFILSYPRFSWAAPPQVAVVYPDLSEPFKTIFVTILAGIQAELKVEPIKIALSQSVNVETLTARLTVEEVKTVIALGRSSVELVEAAQLGVPVIRAAVIDYPSDSDESRVGISLTPDPVVMLQHLKRIAPRTDTVTVVYSQTQVGYLVARARAEAKRLHVALNVHKVDDLIQAATAYRSIVGKLGERDALWLVQDVQAVDERVILPMLLNEAWERKFLLFSSYAEHAKRGALFSVYPDNFSMGKRLARLALQSQKGSKPASIQPLEDLFIAVNLRAAEHVGLDIPANLLRTFDLTFPQR